MVLLRVNCRSAMYTRNKTGLNTDPGGIPDLSLLCLESELSTLTLCCLFERKLMIHCSAFPDMDFLDKDIKVNKVEGLSEI